MIWNFLLHVHTCNLSMNNCRTLSIDRSSWFCLQVCSKPYIARNKKLWQVKSNMKNMLVVKHCVPGICATWVKCKFSVILWCFEAALGRYLTEKAHPVGREQLWSASWQHTVAQFVCRLVIFDQKFEDCSPLSSRFSILRLWSVSKIETISAPLGQFRPNRWLC